MPTNQNAYNARLTDEALEKRFRDTFRSQGGAELVDDLYASGVIVPVVDFTAAAEGSSLRQDLQTCWDFSTGAIQINNTTSTIINNTGFWQVDLSVTAEIGAPTATNIGRIEIFDGSTAKQVWALSTYVLGGTNDPSGSLEDKFVVFLRAGDILRGTSTAVCTLDVWYRQIADVSGNLIQPFGFTSS